MEPDSSIYKNGIQIAIFALTVKYFFKLMDTIIKQATLNWKEGKIKGFLSKQLIDLDNGGLKLIKVEPSSEYPLHLHPDRTEFIYVLEGTPGITIDTEHHKGSQGDFFILPHGIKHAIYNEQSSECILLVGAIKENT